MSITIIYIVRSSEGWRFLQYFCLSVSDQPGFGQSFQDELTIDESETIYLSIGEYAQCNVSIRAIKHPRRETEFRIDRRLWFTIVLIHGFQFMVLIALFIARNELFYYMLSCFPSGWSRIDWF